ncbi:MAG: nucleoside monophosphate kinase [Deltaproteobacteria bacterium]|jgi:adenylate kinase family enzyme|nr:nucleoside monophosphate kinase [Deltaproteobacteria bacterium]
MTSTSPLRSLIRIERIALRGPGALILTGPSSCGKGEVASALCDVLSIDPSHHLSMGVILRASIERARSDPSFAAMLEERHSLSANASVFDCVDTTHELSQKVKRHRIDFEKFLGQAPSGFISDEVSKPAFVSQLDWLAYCTARGLLIPDRWTQELIGAEIDRALTDDAARHEMPIILDGYPRTVAAARHLLAFLESHDVPVLKVLHLSISRAEMLQRAGRRQRSNDDAEALRRRFEFYVENVQPSVDYLKMELGGDRIALIEAHQPAYQLVEGQRVFDLDQSIENVAATALCALGVPAVIVRDLLEGRRVALGTEAG